MKKIVVAQKRLDKSIDEAKRLCAGYVDVEKTKELLQSSEKILGLYERILERGTLCEKPLTKDQKMEFGVWMRQEKRRIKHYKELLATVK